MLSIILLAISAFFGMISFSSLAPVEALYVKQFADFALTGLVLGLPSISFIIFSPIFGWLSDRFGRKKFILVLSFISPFLPLALVWSKNILVYSFFKFLSGIFGVAGVLIFSLLGDLLEKSKSSGFLFGVYIFGPSIGGAIGSLLSGYIASYFGSLAISYYLAFFASLLSLFFLVLALRKVEIKKSFARKKKGGSILLLFSIPILSVLISNFWFSFHMSMRGLLWPFLVKNFAGERIAPFYSSIIFSSMGILVGMTVPLVGKIGDKAGHIFAFFLGWLMMGIAGMALAFSYSFTYLYIFSLLYALGEAFRGPSSNVIITRNTNRLNRGFVFGVISSISSLASFAGPTLTGYLMNTWPVSSILLSYGLLILISGIIFLFLLMKRKKQ